jgi:AcrR family transcriptional regulator
VPTPSPTPDQRAGRADARTRILEAAYDLFCRDGVRAVGIDRVVAEAGVAKMTLYHHFASKDRLVLAFLDLREERWTYAWLAHGVERRAPRPADRSLALFDLLDEWFQEPGFNGCPFLRTLMELPDPERATHQAAVGHLEVVRQVLERHATEGGAAPAGELAYSLQILMMGAILSAMRGDRAAARRVRPLAAQLIDAAR